MKDVHFIITGGTIDSGWYPQKDTVIPLGESSVVPYIQKYVQPGLKVHETVVSMVDSRGITEPIRQIILDTVLNSESNNIIVTHGTYTMADTAKWLQQNVKKLGSKKVVFTGSFYPLVGYCPSDAGFNLGYAMGVINGLGPGVYVAMNAEVFEPSKVKKDMERGKFAKID